ncbi:MAG: deoxyribose-phosphate aldolase [Candidatus Marinimicrobia bacterium]|nr:deoxyribose-phosphate aldolase [Candidatus Neomarinimicrobiota bacterium]
MKKKELAQYLDLANHHPDTTPQEIKKLCQKVKKYGFHAAFVNPCYVSLARELMTDGIVGTVIGFPLGQETQNIKVLAAIEAAKRGADELDVCLNIGLFKAGKEDQVLAEMEAVITAAKNIKGNVLIKFIIETSLLTDEEIKAASQLVLKSGADFVKTNSGFGSRGASLKDVEIIRKEVGGKIKIKVAGGIDTYQEAIAFLEKGANRIGTSKAVEIIKGAKK